MSDADWIVVLRQACERTSQARVAKRLRQADGYPSDAVVNQVLGGRYQHDTARLRDLVRGIYMGATVACPVLGDISLADCQGHARAPYLAGSPLRVALYRACRGCPNNPEASNHAD